MPAPIKHRKGLPDFFIVGAPKCGTTALYHYLTQHPDIFMSPVKEPHFFATDLVAPMYVQDVARYAQLFASYAGQSAVGEASPLYLYSKTALANIAAYKPDAKIIILVRDPVEAAYSLHSGLLANGREDIADFAAALDAESARRAGTRTAKHAIPKQAVYYRDIVSFGEQIDRAYNLFSKDQVKLIFFEELQADPAAVVASVQTFLGVQTMVSSDLAPQNTNKASRLPVIWRRWMAMAPHQRARISAVLPKPVRRALLHLNARRTPRRPLPDSIAKALYADLANDIARLACISGRDLSAWMHE